MWAFDRITAKYIIKYTDKLSSLRMIHCEISTNYKFSQKLLGNYSFKSWQLYLCRYNMFHTCSRIERTNHDVWKYSSSKERSRCKRIWKLFLPSCCSLEGWNKRWLRHEEIPRSSDSLFWIVLFEVSSGLGMRFLSYRFSPWRILSGKARSRELRQKLWTYHQLCIAL